MKKPGLLKEKTYKKDYDFILSLIAKILDEKGINVSIYKEKRGINKLINASLQYLFCWLTEKRKISIYFNFDEEKNKILMKKEQELIDFIGKWKKIISNQLNISESDISLINPKFKNGEFSLDLFSN